MGGLNDVTLCRRGDLDEALERAAPFLEKSLAASPAAWSLDELASALRAGDMELLLATGPMAMTRGVVGLAVVEPMYRRIGKLMHVIFLCGRPPVVDCLLAKIEVLASARGCAGVAMLSVPDSELATRGGYSPELVEYVKEF